MADVLTSEQRRKCMSRIRSKNTNLRLLYANFYLRTVFVFVSM